MGGSDLFAESVVGRREHGRFEHVGVFEQRGSTSRLEMFSPPRMMMSLAWSTM